MCGPPRAEPEEAPKRCWIVCDRVPNRERNYTLSVGDVQLVWAATVEEAADRGLWALIQEAEDSADSAGPTYPGVVFVQPVTDEGLLWRGAISAERVPEGLQCCGGMPDVGTLPTTSDQHTATCPRAPMKYLGEEDVPDHDDGEEQAT